MWCLSSHLSTRCKKAQEMCPWDLESPKVNERLLLQVFVCKYITETECLDSLSIHLANRLSRQLSETRPDNLSKTKFQTIPTAFLSRNLSKNGVNPEIVTQKGWKRLNNLKLRHFNFEFQNFFTFPAFEPEWGKNT